MIARFTLYAAVAGFLLLGMSSCKVSTEALQSEMTLPLDYATGKSDTANLASMPWQIFYRDTCLRDLIGEALFKNPDMKIAVERINLARANYGIAHNALLPQVSAGLQGGVKKFGDYTMDGVGNDDTNNSESLPVDKRLPDPYRELFAGLTFNWEADIWGKLSSQRKASWARMLATQEMTHYVTTTLISDVVQYYYELLGLDQEALVLQTNLELQELGLELIKIQKAGGKVNQLAVDQFEAQLLNIRSQQLSVKQKTLTTEAKINKLLGRYPQPITRYSILDYDSIERVYMGTPQQLLKYRPDIRAAELELAAAHADVNVARAAFFPSVQLAGGAGFAAFDLSKWFLMPASAVYQLSAGLSAPIIQRKQIKMMYDAANGRQRIALAEYEKVVLTSYHEVYSVGTNFYNLQEQIKLKQAEAEVQRRAFNNSNELFSVGYATYLEVITAQRRMLEVELELTELKKEQLKNYGILYRALGGGWRQEGTE